MRKVLLHASILCSFLLAAHLVVLRPVHAAPGKVLSGPARTVAAAAMAGKSVSRSSAGYPIAISKVRFLTKAFGNVVDGNKRALFFFLEPLLPFNSTSPLDVPTPLPAGRSP